MKDPKEKAVYLIHKFTDIANFKSYMDDKNAIKKAAIICVDEILTAIDWHSFETPNEEIQYWQSVKTEIEKL